MTSGEPPGAHRFPRPVVIEVLGAGACQVLA